MELKEINSLVELFFKKYEEIKKITPEKEFLKWLKDNKKDFLTWSEVKSNIQFYLTPF